MIFASSRLLALCLSLCALSMTSASPLAQERTAAGAQTDQTSWQALSNLATAAEGRIAGLNVRVTEAIECGKRGLLYIGKNEQGADALGCKGAAYDDSILQKFIACGNNNQVYSRASDSCRSTSSSQVSANCRLETTTTTSGQCPAGYSSFGTVLTGYRSSGYHDGCETCNPIYTTTCGRSVCQ